MSDDPIERARAAVRDFYDEEKGGLVADLMATPNAAIKRRRIARHGYAAAVRLAMEGDPYAHRLLQERAVELKARRQPFPPELQDYIHARFIDQAKPLRKPDEPRSEQFYLRDSIIARAVEIAIEAAGNDALSATTRSATTRPSRSGRECPSACAVVADVFNLSDDLVIKIWSTMHRERQRAARFKKSGSYQYQGSKPI
jgi:hypothetical protein